MFTRLAQAGSATVTFDPGLYGPSTVVEPLQGKTVPLVYDTLKL